MSVDVLGQLSEAGVSVWLDDISRDRLRTGNLQELADDYHVVGVTSNPTIFAHALSNGNAYDGQVADLKSYGVSVEEASRAITTACGDAARATSRMQRSQCASGPAGFPSMKPCARNPSFPASSWACLCG